MTCLTWRHVLVSRYLDDSYQLNMERHLLPWNKISVEMIIKHEAKHISFKRRGRRRGVGVEGKLSFMPV